MFAPLLFRSLREDRRFLWAGGHLAGLVEDGEEDEEEEAHHRVADDGHNGPSRQASPQL